MYLQRKSEKKYEIIKTDRLKKACVKKNNENIIDNKKDKKGLKNFQNKRLFYICKQLLCCL